MKDKRVYLSPRVPFGWIDAPPSVNRFIGLRWIASLLYPDRFPEDFRADVRDFYRLFYQIDLDEPALERLLDAAGMPVARRPAAVAPMRLVIAVLLLASCAALALALGDRTVPARPRRSRGRAARASSASAAHPRRRARSCCMRVRLPRVAAAALVGAALAGAGTAYQTLFRNPLVSPDILGVSTGAGLGAVAGILLSLPVIGIQALAFAVGLVTVALVYLIATTLRHHERTLVLVLSGIVVGRARGRLHLAREDPGRPVRPASRHHVLAARQPRRRSSSPTLRRCCRWSPSASCRSC